MNECVEEGMDEKDGVKKVVDFNYGENYFNYISINKY